MKHFSTKSIFILIAILFTGISSAFYYVVNPQVSAQSEELRLSTLLERLVQERIDNSSLIIFITFDNPLVQDETVWGIGDPENEYSRSIIEIGTDYVCFREIRGGADWRICTPFTNIVSIRYLNN